MRWLIVASACFGLLVGWPADAAKLKIVTSFSILADLAQEIGGDAVDVTALVGPDGDVHVYQPTPADAHELRTAALFVVNGLGLEGWVDRLDDAAGFSGRKITATDGIVPLTVGLDKAIDPHAWQDVINVRIYVRNIAAGLIAADPTHADLYQQNLARYDAALATLDSWIRDQITRVQAANREVITTHDAFAYFGRAYGTQFLAPIGMAEDSEPSAASVGALIRQITREHVKAVFIENMNDPRLIEQIATEAHLNLGGTLYADALSKPAADGASYIQLMQHNVKAIVAAMLQP